MGHKDQTSVFLICSSEKLGSKLDEETEREVNLIFFYFDYPMHFCLPGYCLCDKSASFLIDFI